MVQSHDPHIYKFWKAIKKGKTILKYVIIWDGIYWPRLVFYPDPPIILWKENDIMKLLSLKWGLQGI